MPNDIYIHPTPAEQRLLERKAAGYGVSVDEFIAWALRQALAKTDKELQLIIKH